MKSALYFITELDGRCRQVVNGVVSSLNKKTPIPSPINTRDIVILWERNTIRWGTIRNFSLPLGFVLDGALILRNDYYRFNIDRQLFFLFKKLVCEVNATHYKIYYKQLYKGEIDMSTFNDTPGESKVDINIQEGGLLKLIKAQENTKYTIPFDDDAINVGMDGIRLDMRQNYSGLTEFIFDQVAYPVEIALPLVKLSNEGTAPYVSFFNEEVETFRIDNDQFKYAAYSTNYPIKVSDNSPTSIDLNFTGKLKVIITTQRTVRQFRLTYWQVPLGATELTTGMRHDLWNTGLMVQDVEMEYDFSSMGTITLNPGDRMFFMWERNPGASPSTLSDYKFVDGTSMQVSLTARYSATTIKAFRIWDVFRKLVGKITGDEANAESAILQASTLVLTSGDAIRGIEGSAITTSFNDLCKAADVYLFTGVQIKTKVQLEGRDTYFVPDSTDPAIELGTVKDLAITPAVDLMYSSIKIGHAEQDIEDVNGKYDFNGYHIYTTPIQMVSEELDLQSPYKAGPYEIEITRINLEGKTTTDNNNDNDVFVLDVVTNAPAIQTVLLSFLSAGNYIVFPASPKIAAGTVFIITGTVSNNVTYTVTAVETLTTTQTVHTDVTITANELVVSATVEFVSGQVYELDRSVIPDSGVPDPDSIFNVRLAPGFLFDKHKRWFGSFLYGFESSTVVFQTANRNKLLVVDGLLDCRDRPIVGFGARIFKPQYLEFGGISPISLQDTLETTPNKCFSFIWDNITFSGFLWKAGLAPNSRSDQVFKMLLTEENDQKDLI